MRHVRIPSDVARIEAVSLAPLTVARWLASRTGGAFPPAVAAPALLVGVAAVILLLAYSRVGPLLVAAGAAVCAASLVWAARRISEERPVWLALAVGCGSLALGVAIGQLARPAPSIGEVALADLGVFGFAGASAVAHLYWPDIRRHGLRVAATLVEAATLVAAVGLWTTAGPGISGVLAAPGAGAPLLWAPALLLPLLLCLLAAPQLPSDRRLVALVLGAGSAGLILPPLLVSGSGAVVGGVGGLVQVVGLGGLLIPALTAPARRKPGSRLAQLPHPPFPILGVLAVLALLGALFGFRSASPAVVLWMSALGGCLCLRELLHLIERRSAHQRLGASLELEARLLAMQGEAGPNLARREALRQSCQLAAEVVKADTVLAWLAEGESLVLTGVAPARRESLVGRRLPLADHEAFATRVFDRGAPEIYDVAAPGARTNRFLSTVLDADTLLGVPIAHESSSVGAFVLVRERGRPAFNEFDQQKAALIAGQAAAALRRLELYGELESQLRETTLVHRFVVQAMSAHNVRDIGWALLESVRSRLTFERALVCLNDPSSPATLRPIAHFRGSNPPVIPSRDVSPAYLNLPMQYGETAVGYVELHRPEGPTFSTSEARVVAALAQQAALAIQNLRLLEESGKASTYREQDRIKTELLTALSHDLRGPLTNVKLYAGAMAEQLGEMRPLEQLEHLRVIEAEADRVCDVLEHLLDLSKIEAGVLRLDLQPVNLLRLVENELPTAAGAAYTFETSVAPEVYVMAERGRVRQVLHNLLENAVKYSPDGGSIVVCATEGRDEVVIAVSDQGVGIPRHQWDRIFRPYQRADTGVTAYVAGSGLGLAICKGIVELHGGRIWVESEPGIGSTFSFTLRRAPSLNSVDEPATSKVGEVEVRS